MELRTGTLVLLKSKTGTLVLLKTGTLVLLELMTGTPLLAQFHTLDPNSFDCSARDWDGKDYLRIIPRVVW